jgi:hypothetical protein
MRHAEAIALYCRHFEGELSAAKTAGTPLHGKLVLVSILDTLSRARHPALVRNNHARFVEFVRTSSGWPESERISAPLLLARLQRDAALTCLGSSDQ